MRFLKKQKYIVKPHSRSFFDPKKFEVAFRGIYETFREESSFRFQFMCAIFVLFLGMFFHIEPYEWLSIFIVIGLVLISETFNTAIENVVDFICPEFDPRAGKIKDIAAAAVLMTSFLAVIIALLVFYDKIFNLIANIIGGLL